MNFIRKHIDTPMAIILALLLINTSVDVIERSVFKPWGENQKNFNEIESLIELITEVGFNMNDLIPENDGEDDQSLKGKQTVKYIKIHAQNFIYQAFKIISYSNIKFLYNQLIESVIFIPPPEN